MRFSLGMKEFSFVGAIPTADNLSDTTDDTVMNSLRDVMSRYTVILGALETWTLWGSPLQQCIENKGHLSSLYSFSVQELHREGLQWARHCEICFTGYVLRIWPSSCKHPHPCFVLKGGMLSTTDLLQFPSHFFTVLCLLKPAQIMVSSGCLQFSSSRSVSCFSHKEMSISQISIQLEIAFSATSVCGMVEFS